MNTKLLLTAALLLTSAGLRAGGSTSGSDAVTAFDRLKGLAGQWEATVKTGKAHLSYEVVAGGSAILERETMEGMPPMLTVYYLDGDRLLLTHYCMAGNQPRMQARRFNPDTGELQFEFLDVTNLATPAAGHMHNAKMRLIDNDHISGEWQFFENGKPKFTESAEYTRVHQEKQ